MPEPILDVSELILTRPEANFKAGCCFCYFPLSEHYESATQVLHSHEKLYYNKLKSEARIKSYLIGRYAAKQAVRVLSGEPNLTEILIKHGIFTQPIVSCEQKHIQICLTHCDNFGAALAFPEDHPMGIDLEKIDSRSQEALERQMADAELKLIRGMPLNYEKMLFYLWTAKEALSKVLKTGLMTPFKVFEINKIDPGSNYLTSYYRNFGQYKAISFELNDYICSITYPLKTEINLDVTALKAKYRFGMDPANNQYCF